MGYKTLNSLRKSQNIYRSRPLPYICRHFYLVSMRYSVFIFYVCFLSGKFAELLTMQD